MRAFLALLFLVPVLPATGQSLNDAMELVASPDAVDRARGACIISRYRGDGLRAASSLVAILGDQRPVPMDVCREILGKRRYWGYSGSYGESTPGLRAAEALSEMGTDVLKVLHPALTAADRGTRLGAARAVGRLEHKSSVDVLIPLLRSESDAEVRSEIAWALGSIEDSQAVEPLVRALDDASIMVRESAAWALGAIESSTAVTGLSRAASDGSPLVRERVAWALGNIERSAGVPALITLLADADPAVREQAAWGLGNIADDKALDALIALLDDRDVEVRRMAAWALSEIEE